jgi:predicted DNA-binding ribbon-helix-helix protein
VALEAEFWAALEALAAREKRSLGALVADIDAQRTRHDGLGRPLASALRVHALASPR